MIITWGIALIAGAWFLGKWTADNIDLLWGDMSDDNSLITETLRFLTVPAIMAVCVAAACVGVGLIGTGVIMGIAALAGTMVA